MRTCRTCPKIFTALAVLALGVLHNAVDQLQNVVLAVDIAEWVVLHGLFEVNRIEYFYLIPAALKHFPTFQNDRAFWVSHDIAGVHLHEVGLDVEAGLAGAGTADHQHIFVDIVLGDFVSPHHDALCLRQENVLVELGIDERLNIVGISP